MLTTEIQRFGDTEGIPGITVLRVDDIRIDGGTQNRSSLDESVITSYARLMLDETAFPPLTVWFDGTSYWLSDGFHRYAAAIKAGFKYVSAQVKHGTLEDALWDSYAANSWHGLPRKARDLSATIKRALSHPRSATLSNVEIAKHLGAPETTVRRWRRILSSPSGEDRIRCVTRNGTTYSLQAKNIGCYARKSQPQSRTLPTIRSGLREMRTAALPVARALLDAVEGWIFLRMSDDECLKTIEVILCEIESNRPLEVDRKV